MADSVEVFLAGYVPEVQEIVQRLRALVQRVLPDADEHVYTGWRNIGYGYGRSMNTAICSIAPYTAQVNLYLSQGAHLPDPHGLLTGTGKRIRHVRIAAPGDIRTRELTALLKAGAKAARAAGTIDEK